MEYGMNGNIEGTNVKPLVLVGHETANKILQQGMI